MTKLQDEILKLLNESNSSKEELKEVSFDTITNEISKLNTSPDEIAKIIENPVQRLTNAAQAAANSLKVALTAYNNVEEYYKAKMGNNEPTKTQAYNLDGTAIPNQTLKYDANKNTNDQNKSTFANPDAWYNKSGNNLSSENKQKSNTNQYKPSNPYTQSKMTVNGQPYKNDGKFVLDLPQAPSLKQMNFQLSDDNAGNYGIYNPWKPKVKSKPKNASESIKESGLELQNEGLGNMISNMMINQKEKKEVINQLENASTMLTQADAQIGTAKQTYIIVYKQLQELAKKIETAKKLINKKKSWYGRMFGFWKRDK